MAEPRYRAPPPDALVIAPLDQIVAVYHRASGQTHLVVPPIPEMIEALGSDAATAAELLTRLRKHYELPDADPAALAARLDELVETGLVERA